MQEFVYKHDTHQYFVDGREIPNVTRVLDAEGYISPFAKGDPIATKFGKNVHQMCWLDLFGNLDEETMSEGLRIPLAGWRKFRRDFPDMTPLKDKDGSYLVERPLYHKARLYGCTPDFPATDGSRLILWDLKTTSGKDLCAWELQTAAYVPPILDAIGAKESTRVTRRVLRLFPDDPTYEIVKLDDPAAWFVWCGVLSSYKWKEKHGKLRQDGDASCAD